MVKKDKAKKIAAWSYMLIILLVLYFPLVWIVIFSFSKSSGVNNFGEFTFEVYANLFDGSRKSREIMTALENTAIIALFTVIFSTILGTLGAIGIFNMKKRSRSVIYTVNRLPLLNPEIVTALSMVGVFLLLFGMLPRGMTGVIIAHTAFCTPYVLLNVLPKLKQMNPNTYEAALDLGASPAQAMFKVILPQIKGGIISGAIMAFTISIDDFVITNYLKIGFDTLSTYIFGAMGGKKALPPELRALSSIMFILVLGLLLIINLSGNKKKKPQT